MRSNNRSLLRIVIAATLLVPRLAFGQAPAGPEAIQQAQPKFYVHADVDKTSRSYREGDSLRVSLKSEVDGFAYVLYQQADGKTFQIFPNAIQKENRVKAGQTVQVPGQDDRFRWIVGPPFGPEFVKVIVAKTPLTSLTGVAAAKERFIPVTLQEIAAATRDLKEGGANWTESQVEITTYARNREIAARGARRYGVYFGISKFEFNDEAREANEGKWQPNLKSPELDAPALDRLFREVGQFADGKVFINEQANKANIRAAVTQWLPSVSRPGDMVFIYFSTHGGKFPPEGVQSGRDPFYYLLPYDYVGLDIFHVLVKRQQEGRLNAGLQPRLAVWADLARRSRNNIDLAEALYRNTCVASDEFGHWMQRLSGRQVVVMLDICHAAGFATREKGLPRFKDEDPNDFAFLGRTLERLKDIGQPESALLAACAKHETAMDAHVAESTLPEITRAPAPGRIPQNLGVVTYYVVERIYQAPASLPLDNAFMTACRADVERYMTRLNLLRRQNGKEPIPIALPRLYNYCTQPIFLKP